MQPQESSVGPIVATIVILAVIVLGGLYFWSQRSSNSTPPDTYGASNVAVPTGSSTTTDNSIPAPTYDVNSTMSGS